MVSLLNMRASLIEIAGVRHCECMGQVCRGEEIRVAVMPEILSNMQLGSPGPHKQIMRVSLIVQAVPLGFPL